MSSKRRDEVPSPPPSLQVKILAVGARNTGKTTFMKRFVLNEFKTDIKTTIGLEYHSKTIHVPPASPSDPPEGLEIQVKLWDIAGQDSTKTMTRSYYQGATGALVMADVERPQTFEEAKEWKKDIDEKVSFEGKPIPVILVANKIDKCQCPYSHADLERMCEENHFLTYFESSAKKGTNVDAIMTYIAQKASQLVPSHPQQQPVAGGCQRRKATV